MVVVVALVLFKHLTDGLSNHSGTNISIPHNPVGLQAKSALYTGEISSDTHTVKTFSNIKLQMLTEWHRFIGMLIIGGSGNGNLSCKLEIHFYNHILVHFV